MTIKLWLLISCVFFYSYMAGQTQADVDSNCQINEADYVILDTLILEEDLIEEGEVTEYLYGRHSNEQCLLLTNEDDYNLFKMQYAKDVDFEEDNVLIGVYPNYGRCHIDEPVPVKISLLYDTWNKKYITSIVQDTKVPYLKIYCPSYIVTAIIPKKYCDKICYAQLFIENEH